MHMSFVFYFARRYDEAFEAAGRALELDQNYGLAHQVVGAAYAVRGMNREAVASFQEAMRSHGESPSLQIILGRVQRGCHSQDSDSCCGSPRRVMPGVRLLLVILIF